MAASQSISLKTLFTDGLLGAVALGITPERAKLLLGTPTDEDRFGLLNPINRLEWVYGNIRFLFIDRALNEIAWQPNLYTYEPCFPELGLFFLDPWIVWNGLTVMEAERELREHSIDFRKIVIPKGLTYEGDSVIELVARSNARLIFRGYLDWFLEGFSLSQRFQINTPLDYFLEYYTY